MIDLDTHVLIRYLAQDDQLQSPIATRLIEGNLTASAQGFVSCEYTATFDKAAAKVTGMRLLS